MLFITPPSIRQERHAFNSRGLGSAHGGDVSRHGIQR